MNYILGAVIAGVLGLVFGSFLNVCASRWPDDKSIVQPRSYCPNCNRQLSWWENLPLLSWLALGGRCRTCRAWIGWRSPLVEVAVAVFWAVIVGRFLCANPVPNFSDLTYTINLVNAIAWMIFLWLLVALAVLDAEHLWLPDRLVLPGIGLGLLLTVTRASLEGFLQLGGGFAVWKHMAGTATAAWFVAAVAPAAVVLVIRWIYIMIRDQEGIGLGDVKLMAMLGGWLGIKMGLVSFGIGVVTCAAFALLMLRSPSMRTNPKAWGKMKLPLGSFICLGGAVCAFWGVPIVAALWH